MQNKKKRQPQGHIFRQRIEDIFCTKDFLKPGIRTNGSYRRPVKPGTRIYNYTSLDIYRMVKAGKDIALTTHINTKFFCLDIDCKEKTQSIYYDNLQPVISAIENIGIEGYIICHNPKGGIKIWIPVPFFVYPEEHIPLFQSYLQSCGLLLSPQHLDFLAKRSTVTTTYKKEFKKGGFCSFLSSCAEVMGDISRLPFLQDELIHTSLWEPPSPLSIEQFYGEVWENALLRNSSFSLSNFSLRNPPPRLQSIIGHSTIETVGGEEKKLPKTTTISNPKKETVVEVADEKLKENSEQRGKKVGAPKGNRNASGTKEERILKNLSIESLYPEEALKGLKGTDLALAVVNKGWTGESQSMKILMQCAILCSWTYRTYDALELGYRIKDLALSLPGYKEYSSEETKKDLSKTMSKGNWAYRWAKSVIRYRNMLFEKKVLRRTWDYEIQRTKEGKYWIQTLKEDGIVKNPLFNGYSSNSSNSSNFQKSGNNESHNYKPRKEKEIVLDPKEQEEIEEINKYAKEIGMWEEINYRKNLEMESRKEEREKDARRKWEKRRKEKEKRKGEERDKGFG